MSMIINPHVFAAAAFPVVVDITESADEAVTANHIITLPGSIQAGELLIAIVATRSASTLTWTTGWTEIMDTGAVPLLGVAYRIADGTEGATITCTQTGTTRRSANQVYRIAKDTFDSGVAPAAPGSLTIATTTTPNPPNLTPSWGSYKALAIASINCYESAAQVPTGFPSGYANHVHTTSTAIGARARLSTTRREFEAASENPGTYTCPNAVAWGAATLAIKGK